jgi:hypothetical protein
VLGVNEMIKKQKGKIWSEESVYVYGFSSGQSVII